ncbi:sec1 family domain-containing protein MIP3 isoform X2 [Malania oleifera]|nr:sec1 family domain-containing protein MIP3 isoform X2 [Malania oleifera]
MCSLDAVVDWNSNCDPTRKIVIMTSRLLSDAHRYILRCLSMHQAVRHCSIFTSISEIAHSAYPDSPLGPDAFHEYEFLLVQDFEELAKKREIKYRMAEDGNAREDALLEDEGWSQLSSIEEDIPNLEAHPTAKDLYGNSPLIHTEDAGQKLAVSVHHFPLILCPFSPRVFVLPSEGSIAEAYLSAESEDSLSPGLPPLSTGLPSYGDEIPPGATLTAHFLYHIAAKMDLKLEIFSLGDLSKTIGKILTDMSSLYDVGRRKRSAGLLLIDRTLDLLTPCCHGDSLVDRMFSCLPRRRRASSSAQKKSSQAKARCDPVCLQRAPLDVKVPLADILNEDPTTDNCRFLQSFEAFLCGWNSNGSATQVADLNNLRSKINCEKPLQSVIDLLSGSFVTTENFQGTPYMEAILDRRTKDGAMLVKKWLRETLRRENIIVNVNNRAGIFTKSELQPMIKALAKSQFSLMKNKGIIQLAAATLYALDELHCARWDAFTSAERILNVSAGDTSQSLAAQIGDLINKSALVVSQGAKSGRMGSSQGLLYLQDALLLTIIGYILAGENFPTSGSGGPFSWQEEHLLKEALVDAVLDNPPTAQLKFLYGLTEELEDNLRKIKSKETKSKSPSQLQIDEFDYDQWGSWGDDDVDNDNGSDNEQVYGDMQLKLELRYRVDNLFKYLHKLSSLKRRNIFSREGTLAFESTYDNDSSMSKGLLYKLLTRVLGKYDVPGLEYHSSTVGRLFKSGFGRFGLAQAKPSLADQNVILVFVIGGINGLEVLEAQEALSESGRPDIELILGGTTLLTPNDMLDILLGNSTYL